MVEAAEDEHGNDSTIRLDWSMAGGIFGDSKMRARGVVISLISSELAAQMRLTSQDHMIEKFSMARADHPFHVSVLPRL